MGASEEQEKRAKKAISINSTLLTNKFFSATKTLGAETTATTSSSVAPSSSSLARSVAVSSEY